MWSLATSKLGISLFAIIAISMAGWYVKNLIEKQVLLERDIEDREMALENVATEFSQYALNSEAVIEAYNVNNEALQEEYQKARNIVSTSIERTIKHDYQKILDANPDAFVKRANAATSRMFRQFEEIFSYSQDEADRNDNKTPLP